MDEKVKRTDNPWKGLQSYQENDIIFGRDEEIKSLYTRILYNTQTVVYGKSGIGKSSIINAGIIPRAKHDEMLPIAIRLAHTTKNDQTPTSPYIEQVLNRIKEEVQNVGGEIEEIVSHVPNHAETLWELMHRIKIWVGKDGNRKRLTPLLLFDQFEEIFTLEIDNKRVESFFAELADLLNEIRPTYLTYTENKETPQDAPQKEDGKEKTRNVFSKIANRKRNKAPEYIEKSEFHLVITLREDFLSYLERYTAYIPVMKQNRFPLLPLNEEQAAKIITEPIKDLIQPDVAEMIIQRVTGRNDFKLDGIPEIEVDAALLSLYMEQLYERKGDDNNIISSELVQFNDDIIKKFYENSIKGISEKTIDYLEDELITNANRRNNVARVDLISGGVSEEELDKLIDKKVLRQFSYGGDLRIEFIHDILCPIVNDRIEHREQLAKEREEQKKKQEEKAKNDAERERILNQQRRERRRFRNTLLWSLVFIVIIISAWLINLYWNQWEYHEYYQAFTRQNGWPVGVGEKLKEQDASRLAVSYRLVRNGRNPSKPFIRVEICSPNKVFLPNFRSPLVGVEEKKDKMADNFSSLNMWVRTIRFSGENESIDASVSRETYYDDKGLLLYAINYYRSIEQNNIDGSSNVSSLWAVYVDQNGLPLKVRDNGADRMKVFLSSNNEAKLDKLEMKYMFYDEQGSPQVNDIGCYGFRVVYNNDLTIDSLYHLDPFSLESFVEVRKYEGEKTTYKYLSISTKKMAIHNQLGYAMRIDISDKKGNVVERRYFDKDGNLTSDLSHCACEKRHYDNYNRLDSISFYDSQRNLIEYRTFNYTALSNMHSEESRYLVVNGNQRKKVFFKSHHVEGNITDNIEEDVVLQTFRHEHIVSDSTRNIIECSFLNREGKLTFDSLEKCYRYTKKTTEFGDGQICVIRYYGEDDRLYKGNSNSHIAAIDSAYYDKDGLKRVQVTFDADGKILKSMGYDYKDGVEITRYALSLDGHTPIRCPDWEIDGLCYYRLNNVKNAQIGFNLAYIQAKSEYEGCSSYVYFPEKDSLDYQFEPIRKYMGENWVRQEQTTITIPPAPDDSYWVHYIHITKLDGEAYKAGFRDGDLVLANETIGTQERLITFMRYHKNNDTWEYPKPIRISKYNCGMEIYPIAYTKDEYNKFLKGKKLYEN